MAWGGAGDWLSLGDVFVVGHLGIKEKNQCKRKETHGRAKGLCKANSLVHLE